MFQEEMREAVVQRREREWVREIHNGIEIVMTPFRPNGVTVYLTETYLDYGKLTVEVETLPNNPLVLNHSAFVQFRAQDLDGALGFVIEKFVDHFQSIRLPVGEHIELGEN